MKELECLILKHFSFVDRSWSIAIKSIRKVTVGNTGYMDPERCNDHWDSLKALLEEAKTMQGVGQYHDHIVNLQGITAIAEDNFLTQVILLEID